VDYRRLQMSKGGSFLLSLPKEWVKANKLEGGAILKLTEGEGGSLVVRAEGVGEGEKGVAAYIREPEGLERQIRANYLSGADMIVIELGKRMTPTTREAIKSAIHKLIGLEIVEEEANSMTVQCLLQPTSMPVRSTLKRAYTLAANMHRDAETALSHGDLELAETVERRDDEVDRLYFLIVRQLRLAIRSASVAEKLGISPPECLDLRMAAKYIETIADYAGAVASTAQKLKEKELDKEIMVALLKLSDEAYKIHEGAALALFRQDFKLSEGVLLRGQALSGSLVAVDELLMNKQPRIAALLDSIAIYFYQIGAHGIDLAELVSGATV